LIIDFKIRLVGVYQDLESQNLWAPAAIIDATEPKAPDIIKQAAVV